MSDPSLLNAILRYQGVEYAVCDADRRIREHSPGLPSLVTMQPPPQTVIGWRLEDLFDEFMGAEACLSEGLCASEPCFRLMHVYRDNLGGQPGYLTITVIGYSSGLLVMVSDATREGDMAWRLMQQRNEMMLLQDRLKAANARLDYLLHHFVPIGVARQLMTQRELPHVGGQRRTVSVLFADVRGYTMLAESIESEIVMNVLNRQFTVVGSVITEYGGAINQYAGDQIMAIFNAVDTQPDHALRAVNAALAVRAALVQLDRQTLDLRAALAQLDRQAAGDLVTTVRFGFGINTGPAVVGYLGFEDRFDYTAIGDVVNVAARLSTAAHADEVLMGPQTYEAVGGHIQARPVGPLRLRGRATPVMAYEALG